jgi:spore coat protein A, manganese oxidase
MEISRRNLLGAGAAVGAGVLLPLNVTTAANAAKPIPNVLTPFTEQLPTLASLGVIDATGGTATTPATAMIEMVNASHTFHTALAPTPTFAYRASGGSQGYLGPVIVAKKDVPLDLTVVNNLGAHPLASVIDYGIMGTVSGTHGDATAPRAAVHLHGGNTDPASDGDPMDFFGHGETKTYHYGNTQEAAGLWYHDHAVGITRLNVFVGLASGYLLRDANDPGDGSTGLPPAPAYEVPLILQDRMFNSDGSFNYPPNPDPVTPGGGPWIPEFFGDVATVNGKAWPNLAVDRGKYRFRVYNGSQARFYNMKLKTSLGHVVPFFQIGSDGGLLNAPVALTKLLLAPGERADLVIDFAVLAVGTKVVLTNDANAPFPSGPTAIKRGGVPLPQLMQFTVTKTVGWTTPLPTNLRLRTAPVTRLAGAPVTARKNMALVEVHNADDDPTMVLMNNRHFMPDDTRMTVGTNTLEQWDLINTTVDAHPMHLHFTQFQVLNRQKFDAASYLVAAFGVKPEGAPIWPVPNTGDSIPVAPFLRGGASMPGPNEQGWKDTVVAMPGEVTRILVPFGAHPAGVVGPMAIGTSHTGKYVSHCHILEHEENDMMMRFNIV